MFHTFPTILFQQNTHTFFKVPVMNFDWHSAESEASATSDEFLLDGWKHPAEEFSDRDGNKREKIILKANTFMASSTK